LIDRPQRDGADNGAIGHGAEMGAERIVGELFGRERQAQRLAQDLIAKLEARAIELRAIGRGHEGDAVFAAGHI
jgi:hypothetical protein